MKIATFNINNVNKRLRNLLAWLNAAKPDVACLQELKATDLEFPVAAIARLLGQGWIDAIRTLHPDAKMYTFWEYMRNRWQRDAGLRLDHLLLNRIAANRLAKSGVDRDVRGLANASDHAPAWIMLRTKPAAPSKPARSVAKPMRRKAKRSTPLGKVAARPPLLVIDGDSFAHHTYHALPNQF